MPVDFKVKWNVKVNGKKYGSPEEMPPEVREAWEKARARQGTPGEMAVPGRITFNGKEYASAEEMPAEDRALYESVMKTLRKKAEGTGVEREVLPPRRQGAEEGPPAAVWVRRVLIAAALLALAWMALAQLAGAPGR